MLTEVLAVVVVTQEVVGLLSFSCENSAKKKKKSHKGEKLFALSKKERI